MLLLLIILFLLFLEHFYLLKVLFQVVNWFASNALQIQSLLLFKKIAEIVWILILLAFTPKEVLFNRVLSVRSHHFGLGIIQNGLVTFHLRLLPLMKVGYLLSLVSNIDLVPCHDKLWWVVKVTLPCWLSLLRIWGLIKSCWAGERVSNLVFACSFYPTAAQFWECSWILLLFKL